MRKFLKPVTSKARPGAVRVRRAISQSRAGVRRDAPLPDLSSLILYGQG